MSDEAKMMESNLRSLCATGYGGQTAEWALTEIDILRAERDALAAEVARLKADIDVVKSHAETTAALRDHWRASHEVACATLAMVQGRLDAISKHAMDHPSDLSGCLEGCKCSKCAWVDLLLAMSSKAIGPDSLKTEAAKQAPPARTVEELAKVFVNRLEMSSHLCDDPELPNVARWLAADAIAHLSSTQVVEPLTDQELRDIHIEWARADYSREAVGVLGAMRMAAAAQLKKVSIKGGK